MNPKKLLKRLQAGQVRMITLADGSILTAPGMTNGEMLALATMIVETVATESPADLESFHRDLLSAGQAELH